MPLLTQRQSKLIQLLTHPTFLQSSMVKGISRPVGLVHKIGLPDATTPVNGRKLRILRAQKLTKFLNFNFSTYHNVNPSCLILAQSISQISLFGQVSQPNKLDFLPKQNYLQRNVKSQAVSGEPGRAGSAPIASAATTPQPAGRSIANSAAICRCGINVRLFGLFDCSDCSIVRLAGGGERRGQARKLSSHHLSCLSTTLHGKSRI